MSKQSPSEERADARYLIRKGGAFYRPNAQGYTSVRSEAGRYTLAEAIRHSHPNGPDGPRDGIDYFLDTDPSPQPEARAWPLGGQAAKDALASQAAQPAEADGCLYDGEAAWDELVNKDDRTSPEEYPDMCLITRDELLAYMDARATPPAPATDAGEVEAPPAPYLSDRFEWAAPGDQQEDAWIVRFCDQGVRDALYTGPDAEREAREAWERHAPGYNMYLFRLVRLATPPAPDDDLRAALEARDVRVSECPDTKLDPNKDCPRCGASSNEGCRITALADAGFVHAARAALKENRRG